MSTSDKLMIILFCSLFSFTIILLSGIREEVLYIGTVKSVDVYGSGVLGSPCYLVVFEDGREVRIRASELSHRPFVGDVMLEVADINWCGWYLNKEWRFE